MLSGAEFWAVVIASPFALLLIGWLCYFIYVESPTNVGRAAAHGNLTLVKFFMRRNVDLNSANQGSKGYTPLECAAANDRFTIVQFLVENGAHVVGSDALVLAAHYGNLPMVKYLLQKGADPNHIGKHPDRLKQTALMAAAFNNHLDTVRYLVEKGADLNLSDSGGRSALILAIQGNRYLDVVKYLVDNDANLNHTDNDNFTAVNCAACRGYDKTMKYLVEKGADINITNRYGVAPIGFYAARYLNAVSMGFSSPECLETMRFLIENHGANHDLERYPSIVKDLIKSHKNSATVADTGSPLTSAAIGASVAPSTSRMTGDDHQHSGEESKHSAILTT